jgi:uncharacterized Zn-binding protein involved in type VI secretion
MSRPMSRMGDKCITGHACSFTAPVEAKQFEVFSNGIPNLVMGDKVAFHLILAGKYCIPHLSAVVNKGSMSVFVKGIPAARIGDSTDQGMMYKGSQTVFAGG